MPEKIVLGNISLSDFAIGVLYAIATISGALGGCAAGMHYYANTKTAKWAFVIAYVILGAIFGVIFFAGASVYNFRVGSVHELVLYSTGAGSAGSIMLFSANWTVKAIFRRLGVEVEVTLRRDKEDRRNSRRSED